MLWCSSTLTCPERLEGIPSAHERKPREGESIDWASSTGNTSAGVRIAGPFCSENYLARTSALGATSKVGRARIKSFRRSTAPKIMNPPKMASLPGSGTALIEKGSISGLEIGSLRAKRRNQITPFIPTVYKIEEDVREMGNGRRVEMWCMVLPKYFEPRARGFAELRRKAPAERQRRRSETYAVRSGFDYLAADMKGR